MPNNGIKIFQIYYKDGQKGMLDPAFSPYDCRSNPWPEYYEIGHILNLYKKKHHMENDYVGVVSHKFGIKSKITGKKFIDFIRNNIGYDVYFFNPFPQNVYHSFNVWEHGEAWHPGLKQLAQLLFDQSGYNINVDNFGRNTHDTLLYCNFWVGNRKFWNEFMGFIIPLFKCITEEMTKDCRSTFFVDTTHIRTAPMFPFIFERLFSTFISIRNDILSCPYQHTSNELLNACLHKTEQIIVEHFKPIIDEWDRKEKYSEKAHNVFSALLRLNINYSKIWWSIDGPPY